MSTRTWLKKVDQFPLLLTKEDLYNKTQLREDLWITFYLSNIKQCRLRKETLWEVYKTIELDLNLLLLKILNNKKDQDLNQLQLEVDFQTSKPRKNSDSHKIEEWCLLIRKSSYEKWKPKELWNLNLQKLMLQEQSLSPKFQLAIS